MSKVPSKLHFTLIRFYIKFTCNRFHFEFWARASESKITSAFRKQGVILRAIQTLICVILATLLLTSCSSEKDTRQTQESLNYVKIIDPKGAEIFDSEAQLEMLADGFIWSEGPLWVEELNCLLFSDIPNNKVHKYCPEDGLSVYLDDSGKSNGLALNANRELVLMRGGPRNVSIMDASLNEPKSEYRVLVDKIDGKRLNSPNDVSIASNGTMYFTDPPYELEGLLDSPLKELSYQGVFKLDSDLNLSVFDDELTWPNGALLSADETTLYVAVSDPQHTAWYRYELDENGDAKSKSLFFDASKVPAPGYEKGLPDGLKWHSSGVIVATGPGGVWAFSQDGELLARILIADRPVSNVALDEREEYLYLTAADQLLRIKLKN